MASDNDVFNDYVEGSQQSLQVCTWVLRLLSHQFALLSERSEHETLYGLFVNIGKSIIPADLQMEYLVRLTKGYLRSMCSNVTEKSLVKRSCSFFRLNKISDHYDQETCTIKRAQRHKRLSSFADENKIISSLRAIRLWLLQVDKLRQWRRLQKILLQH